MNANVQPLSFKHTHLDRNSIRLDKMMHVWMLYSLQACQPSS